MTTLLGAGDNGEGGSDAPEVPISHLPQERRVWGYLLAENHLVVKQEEDPLLVPAIGLVDPGHFPSVDQFRAPV